MKKIIALILAVLVALASWGAMAQSVDHQSIAQSYVPEGSTYLTKETDDGHPEYRYFHADSAMLYEITLDAQSGMLRKMECEALFDEGAREVTLTEENILAHLLTLFPDAADVRITLRQDDGFSAYQAHFVTPLFTGEVKLHPETGALLEQTLDYTRPQTQTAKETTGQNKSAKAQTENTSALIGKDKASSIALNKAGGGAIRYIKLDRDDGRQVYEGELILDNYEYEFEIDAQSGSILDWDRDHLEKDDD